MEHKSICLVTGGAGYIGSHTVIELLNSNSEVIILDNFTNSNEIVINRIKEITEKKISLYKGDVRSKELLHKIFSENKIDTVFHFAGLKSVSESVSNPLSYYSNNVSGTITLLQTMVEFNVKNVIFSSSATVYGRPEILPISENSPTQPTNPYGQSKLMAEEILTSLWASNPSLNIIILRYFNPVGAHESGLVGESPNETPNNLMPYIAQTAIGTHSALKIFGNDYETIDGTGVRDYIHVVDLALGHIAAMRYLKLKDGAISIFNLGTGKGSSVLEVLRSYEKASGINIPHEFHPRRDGDVASCYCDPSQAKKILGWEALYDLNKMCEDSWKWQRQNPEGFKSYSS